MNVVIFGSKGYLGEQFLTVYPHALTPSIDIADAQKVAEFLDLHHPDFVINCAGKTGRPNVDWCEDHKSETVHSNVTGPLVLLDACTKRGIYFVHLSSGCIYEGDNGGRGFTEEDAPNFYGSFYSRSKIWSDQILQEFPVLILRIRMPFDGSVSERSLITKLRKYSRVLDEENSLTYLPDFLMAAKTLIERKKTGVFNVVNPQPISPYRIMELYREIVDPSHTFEKLTVDHLGEVVRAGRSNCFLSGEKLQSEGITMRSTEEVVTEAMTMLREVLR